MFCCGLVGLLVPAALILRWKLLGSTFGQLEAVLWPSSIILMGLEGPTQRSAVLLTLSSSMRLSLQPTRFSTASSGY
jgi:hypothetical protein